MNLTRWLDHQNLVSIPCMIAHCAKVLFCCHSGPFEVIQAIQSHLELGRVLKGFSKQQRFNRDSIEVRQRFGRGSVEVRQRFGRGQVEVRQRFGRGSVEVRQRFGRGSVEVRQRFGRGAERFGEVWQRLRRGWGPIENF